MKKLFLFSIVLSILQIGCSSWPSYYDEYWNNLYEQFSIPTEEFHNQNYEKAKILLWKYLEIDTAIANYEAYAFLSQTYFRLGLVDSGRMILEDGILRMRDRAKFHLSDSVNTRFRLREMGEWFGNYPQFPDYLKKENGFVPYDTWPEPVNGMDDISRRLKYPRKALRNETEGRVIVVARIDEKGEVISAEILKSLSPECDAAAISVILDTQFTVCRRKGKIERARVAIPIVFRL